MLLGSTSLNRHSGALLRWHWSHKEFSEQNVIDIGRQHRKPLAVEIGRIATISTVDPRFHQILFRSPLGTSLEDVRLALVLLLPCIAHRVV